jgi:histidine triad (HIT) family protein
MAYDPTNVFARILRGEIPCNKAGESQHALAFHDIAPRAPTHILVIPRGNYIDAADFGAQASAEEIADFHRLIAHLVAEHGLDKTGYRLISNAGQHGGQEVPHYHVHILGGKSLGPMLSGQ